MVRYANGGRAGCDVSMSIFDVLRETAELVRRDLRVPLVEIQRRFALSDHDLTTIVDELTGPRGEASVEDGRLVLRARETSTTEPVETLQPVETLRRGETEHRDLAVLFCDLVGSTELSTRLDAEDFSETIRTYFDVVTAVFDRYGGHVANLMGDGLLVLFGYPRAQDDSARQAVAAALAAIAAIDERGLDFEIRIGLHVGPVVVSNVGPGGRAGALALGETVNVAARVQSSAEPGGVCITHDLSRRVEGWFELEPVGAQLFKGLSVPMEIHRVVGSTGARSAIEARQIRGLSPVLGRAVELDAIRDAWTQARNGSGRMVALIGEPGIGKSRLIEEVRREILAGDGDWFSGACSPYSTATALHPFGEIEGLGSLSRATPPDALSAEGRRKWVLAAMNDRIVGQGVQRPGVLAIEDVHWADPTSMELLDLVRANLNSASVLVLLTSREPLPAHWAGERVQSLALAPLDFDACTSFVAGLARDRSLSADALHIVVERSGGNPLYLEELTNMLLQADGELRSEEIPPALQSPLLARLDGLGDAKPIAQVASVVGVQFSAQSLHSVLDLDHRERMTIALDRMVDKGLIFADPRNPDRYTFRHALIHHAAYQSALKKQRREIHGRVVDQWRAGAERDGEPAVEIVARHAAAAERHSDAADLYALAGRRAAERSAHNESAQHFVSALESLAQVDGDTTRRRLDIQRSQASTLVALLGYTHPQTAATWQQTYELALQLDDLSEITSSLLGLAIVRYGSADLVGATELIDDAMRGAEQTGDDAQMIAAFAERTVVAYFGGDFVASLRNGEAAMAKYDAGTHHHRLVELVGDDSGVAAASTSAWALMQLGRFDEALARGREAIAIAESTGHPFSVGQATLWNALMVLELGSVDLAEMEALIAFCDEQDFRLWGGAARVVAAAIIGDPVLHHEGRNIAAATSSLAMVSAICGILSDTLRLAGDFTGALAATDDGLAFADAVQLPYWSSGLLRRRAELLDAGAGSEPTSPADIEALLRQSLDVAERQSSRWNAMMTATRLATHLVEHGRAGEARAVLAPRVDAIVGGDQLTNVIAARALLASLPQQEVNTAT